MSKNWRKHVKHSVLLTVFLFVAVSAKGNTEVQSLESIRTAAYSAIEQHSSLQRFDDYTVRLQQLDNRLRLRNCSRSLSVQVPSTTLIGRQSIEVSCSDTPGWKIYLQATIEVRTQVPVLIQPIGIGEPILESNMRMQAINLDGRSGQLIAESMEQVADKIARRPISAGSAIALNSVKMADLIEAGQIITLELAQQGLRVTMTGKASKNAQAGEWIRAVNLDSGKYVEGRVNPNGTLQVLKR